MKILYDHQIFSFQKYGGISRYFCELLDQFSADPTIQCTLPLRYSNNKYLRTANFSKNYWFIRNYYPGLSTIFNVFQKNVRSSVTEFFWKNQKESEKMLTNRDFDIFHPTYYNPYFLKHLGKKPFVLTVYDMIHERYPDFFPSDDQIPAQKKILIEKASRIISISENTKKDIIKFCNVDPGNIDVIYLGNSFNSSLLSGPISEKNHSGKFILFVGSRSAYKNFYVFLEAIRPILSEHKDLYVVCAGGGHFSPREVNFIKSLNLHDKIHQCEVNDEKLAGFYRHAYAFIFPSLYEGFGIPVLESFSCGCPVLLSNTSSLPEVAGNAALYFDPQDAVSMREAVEEIIENPGLRAELIAKGKIRSGLFSWEKTAQKTKELYKQVSAQS